MRLALHRRRLAFHRRTPPPIARSAPAPTDRWHAKAREIYAHAISIPTVQGRGRVPELAQYLAGAVPRRRPHRRHHPSL